MFANQKARRKLGFFGGWWGEGWPRSWAGQPMIGTEIIHH
jgi:hypothetical protein